MTQYVVLADDNGVPYVAGNGVSGASAAKQDEQTAVLNTIASASLPDKETPTMLYRVKVGQSFTGASAGDPVIGILTINTVSNTFVSNTPLWYNGRTKLPLVDADVDTSKLEVVAANALTATELATLTLAISSIDLGLKADSEATDSTSSWSAIALFKGIFKFSKGDRGAGNVSATTQRVTLANDGAGVASLASIATSQAITYIESPVVSIGLTSTQSSVVGASTNRVIITPTIDCWVAIGSNPTATVGTTGSFFLAGGIASLPITVTPSTTKLAVISNDSATGKLSRLGIS